jgi:hypothetical protein
MSYDSWKTTEPDDRDPGRGSPSRFRLTCEHCDWSAAGVSAGAVFQLAFEHQHDTRHTILSHGVPQAMARADMHGGEA